MLKFCRWAGMSWREFRASDADEMLGFLMMYDEMRSGSQMRSDTDSQLSARRGN